MSKKLLLADDSITIQKVIQITFAHEDYELTITDNGDAALVKAQEVKPDLIMTDIYMPGKNGYELTSAIKQDPALQHIPVLLLAGSFEPFDENKARDCKADAWIEKPFESQSLIDKVAELLSAAQAAPVTPEAPSPAVEPISTPAVEETPLAAFDEAVGVEPEMAAASDDPFGDISFEEEVPVAQPEPVAAADDWSDVAAEPTVEEAFVEETAAVAASVEDVADDFSFATESPAEDISEDFSFAEEETVVAADLPPLEEPPAAEVDLDVFEMGDDEIMPLDDDDILGAEDLEPPMPEQTLAAWSRDDVFSETIDEAPAIEDDDVFAMDEPVVDEPSVFEEPVADIPPVFEEAVAPVVETPQVIEERVEEPAAAAVTEPEVTFAEVTEEPSAVVEAPEPAAVATTLADVEAKASALSEEDLERIIEKVVANVVEKLAGSILERVAWDVVPDLAENLIREEIRKIKDAAA